MQNKIHELQNKEENINLLKAQSVLYSQVKNFQLWQFILTVIIPVIFVLLGLIVKYLLPYAAIYSLIILFIDEFWLLPKIQKQRKIAACVKEKFDINVLGLDDYRLVLSCNDLMDEIIEKASKYNNTNEEKLKNWYLIKDYPDIDLAYLRLICQRSNLSWDIKLREKYESIIFIILIIVLFVLVFIRVLLGDRDIINISLNLASFSSYIGWSIKNYLEQRDAIQRLKQCKGYIDTIFESIQVNNYDSNSLLRISESIQQIIFEKRASVNPIPSWLYNKSRQENEKIMSSHVYVLIDNFRKLSSNLHETSSK